jgi:FMN phosphatase YigB (HAD superfamily)
LSLHYLFNSVVITEDVKADSLSTKQFIKCLKDLEVKPQEAVYVSSKPNRGIQCANEAGIVTVRIRQGDSAAEEPKSPAAKAKYEINRLSEILETLSALQEKPPK